MSPIERCDRIMNMIDEVLAPLELERADAELAEDRSQHPRLPRHRAVLQVRDC